MWTFTSATKSLSAPITPCVLTWAYGSCSRAPCLRPGFPCATQTGQPFAGAGQSRPGEPRAVGSPGNTWPLDGGPGLGCCPAAYPSEPGRAALDQEALPCSGGQRTIPALHLP